MRRFRRLHRRSRDRLERDFLARDDMDADIAGPAHQIVHDRAVKHFEPARTRRLADDDLRHVVRCAHRQ